MTVCTRDRLPLFGEIRDGVMHLTEAGRIVEMKWHQTAASRPHVRLDAFVVMPDHFHGIVWIMEDGSHGAGSGGAARCAPTPNSHRRVEAASLSAIMRAFKSAVTCLLNAHRSTPGHALWQRGFYEHVVRDTRGLGNIRRYIADNPARWADKWK